MMVTWSYLKPHASSIIFKTSVGKTKCGDELALTEKTFFRKDAMFTTN
jgi:hypothetical protein